MASARPFVIPSLAALLVGLALSAPALADAPPAAAPLPPDCAAGAPPLPEALRGWAVPAHMAAAGTVSALDHAVLAPGQAVMLALRATPDVSYALQPDEPGGTVSSGGMVAFDAPVAGTYRVMLNARAWLDVVRGGSAVASTHHEHGPACSSIGKMVDFALPAGRAIIQLSGSGTPEIEIMVVAAP
ncbi:hypothetical protein [Gluconacetobacter takamatsuzukensis]|uniref:Homogentisate 1,2-dioxygenase n=1 Tax=Gluconacetobacter takamatsuzukensis TaxID=1286190 RepID=A0A7W4PT18_9PROT|nr:hypothetical protein [Gluconacetobacter takamatsuzukensis]MBB2205496.1 hypothetical protein [Gluconacetobacter takamatsuzukensis]